MKQFDLYNKAPERLWEKMEFWRVKFIDFNISSGREIAIYNFKRENNLILRLLIREVNEELNYKLDNFQINWSIIKFLKKMSFESFNRINETNLQRRG